MNRTSRSATTGSDTDGAAHRRRELRYVLLAEEAYHE